MDKAGLAELKNTTIAIMNKVNVSRKKCNVIQFCSHNNELLLTFNSIFTSGNVILQDLKKGKVCERPENMVNSDIREELERRGISASGDRQTLIEKYRKSQPSLYNFCVDNQYQLIVRILSTIV